MSAPNNLPIKIKTLEKPEGNFQQLKIQKVMALGKPTKIALGAN